MRAHYAAEWFPELEDSELRELAADINANGQREPCVVGRVNGEDTVFLFDGRNRLRACESLNREIRTRQVEFETHEEAEQFVISANLHRRHLTTSQRAMIAALLIERHQERARKRMRVGSDPGENFPEGPGRAHDHAAEPFQVSGKSVGHAVKVRKKGTQQLVDAVVRGDVSVSAAARVAEESVERQEAILAEGPEAVKDHAASKRTTRNFIHNVKSSNSNEWYTPELYITAIRDVMGGIDLDPASCEWANKVIQAREFFTEEDDGLARDWYGKVFLNPPYGRNDEYQSNQSVWSGYMLRQFEQERFDQGCLLVNAYTETEWFQKLFAHPMCFIKGRIQFYTDGPKKTSPTSGSAIVYFTRETWRREVFRGVFSEFGHVVLP